MLKKLVVIAVAGSFAAPVVAELPASEIAKLGNALTPLGGEKAANAAGTIPAWTGGITRPVAGYKPGSFYPDPFKDDKPTMTITGANADQYRAQLRRLQPRVVPQEDVAHARLVDPVEPRLRVGLGVVVAREEAVALQPP